MATPKTASRGEQRTSRRRRVRAGVSVLLALHLTAVIVGPWAFAPQRSLLAASFYRPLAPYIQGAGLDNGYRFFAPQPTPSHLLRYELACRDGRKVGGTLPDRRQQWPRLRYHRHLMLAEFLHMVSAVPASERERPGRRRLTTAIAAAYARQIAAVCAATEVTLHLRTHRLPSAAEVLGGMSLSDEALYREEPLGTFPGASP
jgi:hypothetical protein